MTYEIIGTAVSSDRSICYSVFRQNICIDMNNADTYGISAADITRCSSVNDVVTDRTEICRLLDSVSRNSVSVCGLKDFVCDYVESI